MPTPFDLGPFSALSGRGGRRWSACGHPLDAESIDLGGCTEEIDGSETLSGQAIGGEGGLQAPEVAIDDGLVDDPADASRVPGGDDRGRKGEDDGNRRHARRGRPHEEGPPSGRLDVGRVDDSEPPSDKPLLQLAMEDRKGEPRRSLVRGVARDRLAIGVGREDLGRGKEAGGQRRLAGPGRPDKDDQRWIGDPKWSRRADARRPSLGPVRRR